jgi:OOP family OmpA-OmpF porin
MNGVAKFIIGGVATSLMAMAAHSTVSGAGFIDKLQSEADAKVSASGLPGVTAAFTRQPMLTRNVVLSGDASAADRERLIAELKATPGVGSVTWAGAAAPAAEAPAPVAAPTPAAVTHCQTDVDAAVNGKEILFDTGQTTLSTASNGLLDGLATSLKSCAGVAVEVAGHTDAQGAANTNLALSERRAKAVVAALAARGVPADRLTAKGYGETQPKVPSGPDDANAQNRRIEFKAAPAAAAG